jgi:Hemerythrin HHE cation binding domain
MSDEIAATHGPIARHLAADHARLDALLGRAVAAPGAVARAPYDAFREGLLRHIALEEKILFPALRATTGGAQADDVRRLRVEHGALASLLVPPPTLALVAEIRSILVPHNRVEDAPGGLYDRCDAVLAARSDELVDRMRAYPRVKVAPYADGPRVLRTAADALRLSARAHGER